MKKNYKKIVIILSSFIMLSLVFGGYYFSKIKVKDNVDKNKAVSVKTDNENKNNEKVKNEVKIKEVKEREFKGENLKYNDKPIPVLMYHSIAYEAGNELRVPKEKFREQMKFLKDSGYTTLTLAELHSFLTNNKPIPEKSIAITFDDGYMDNYENAYPVLKEFGLNGTVFVITGAVDQEKDYLTSAQIKEMDSNGLDVESHTFAHDQLDVIPYDKQMQTLKTSKDFLEKALNKKVEYIAYPYGKWNKDTIKAAKDLGYKMAFTTVGGWTKNNKDIYTLDRVYISSNFGIEEFKNRVINPQYNNVQQSEKTEKKK